MGPGPVPSSGNMRRAARQPLAYDLLTGDAYVSGNEPPAGAAGDTVRPRVRRSLPSDGRNALSDSVPQEFEYRGIWWDALVNRSCYHYATVNVLGTNVNAIDIPMALARIDGAIRARDRMYVCVTGVHGVMESLRDPDLQAIHNRAGLVTPDGMPLVWLGRLAGYRHMTRVYGPDLMLAACERSLDAGYRHFFYGGGEGVADLLAERLQARFPGLQVAGTYCPPFRPLTPAEDQALLERIEDVKADIVWVGLSTPKQERFMAAHVGHLSAPVMIGVGAAFDFHAGLKRQAPRWMQRSGLEWLFRLVTEPRRLWKRYLVNHPLFVYNVLLQLTGLRRYDVHRDGRGLVERSSE